MGDVKFAIEPRNARGKGVARKLRARGMAPGVVYGRGREATSISFDATALQRLLDTSHGGLNTLIDLEGDSPAAGCTVIAKELQREPIRGKIMHVDFFEVDLKAKIEIAVPIHLVGNAAGVVLGGVLDQQQREVVLLCMPDAIPDDIEVDVSGMELGDSLHIRDLVVPAGVEFHTDDSLTVATVLVPRGLKEDEEQPEGEGEEGADAEAEGGDATDEKSEDEAK